MLRACVLGATGMVGQRFVQILADHPKFEIVALTASERSAGKKYAEAAKWYLDEKMPEDIGEMEVLPTDPSRIREEDVDVVFSALPSEVARDVEPEFARAGFIVCSNASAYRMEEDVPLVIPEVNPDHLELIGIQRERRGWRGAIVTNPNCSTIILTLALKPIMDEFGLDTVIVSTMQAVSGAGYWGVPSMAILDNVIPFIKKEEEKIQTESLKILGNLENGRVVPARIKISASCHRVPVLDGHLEAVFVKTLENCTPDDVKDAMRRFRGLPQELGLYLAPKQPIWVFEEDDRPQPRLDRYLEKGMAIAVGRVRQDPALGGIKFVVLGHNTIRGAAGASVLNAELLFEKYF